MIKNCPNITKCSIFNSFFFFFSIKRFLNLLIMIFSDLFSFFSLQYTVCLGEFVLKRLIISSIIQPRLFIIGSRIQLTNQSYQVFLNGGAFFISFSSKLSISSVDTIIGLKNSTSIALLIFTSLSLYC